MEDLGFKSIGYYVSQAVIWGTVGIISVVLAGILMAHAAREGDNWTDIVIVIVLLCLFILGAAMTFRYIRLSELCIRYRQFQNDIHYIEHNITEPRNIQIQMSIVLDDYDKWVTENWRFLRDL